MLDIGFVQWHECYSAAQALLYHTAVCATHALQANQPAFYVPQYLQSAGVEVVPVPVFYPDVQTILGQPVYRKVKDVPGRQAWKVAESCTGSVLRTGSGALEQGLA